MVTLWPVPAWRISILFSVAIAVSLVPSTSPAALEKDSLMDMAMTVKIVRIITLMSV